MTNRSQAHLPPAARPAAAGPSSGDNDGEGVYSGPDYVPVPTEPPEPRIINGSPQPGHPGFGLPPQERGTRIIAFGNVKA